MVNSLWIIGGEKPVSAFLGLLIGLLSLLVIGEILLRALRRDRVDLSRMERFVVTFALGNGAVVLEMFFFILGNLPLTLWALAMPWILVGASLLYGWWGRRQPSSLGVSTSSSLGGDALWPSGRRHAWVWWELLVVLAIGLTVLDVFVSTLTTPFLYLDAIWFWTPKAKLFYQHRFTPFAAFHDFSEFVHPDYPLFLPLTEVWLFLWMGGVNEYFMKLLSPVYMMLLVLSMWAFVRRFCGQRAALIAAGLLATTPFVLQHGTMAFADLPLAFYYWLATALLLAWFQTPQPLFLLLGAVFLGLSGLIKNEGLPLIVLNGCALAGYLVGQRKAGRREIQRALLLFGGVSVGMVLPWLFVRYRMGLESDLSLPSLSSLLPRALQRIWPMAKALAREMFAPSSVLTKWNLAWYLLVLVVVLHGRTLWRSVLRYPALILAGQALVYLWIYIITPYNINWHLSSSLDRLLLHGYPLALVLIGCSLGTELSGFDRE